MFRRILSLPCLLALLGLPSGAQESQRWTERRNLGVEGPVRSALTTVVRPNPDPRPQTQRKLMVQANPDWAAFDTQERRIEFASASSRLTYQVVGQRRRESVVLIALLVGTPARRIATIGSSIHLRVARSLALWWLRAHRDHLHNRHEVTLASYWR
jgi:hypothetical protein